MNKRLQGKLFRIFDDILPQKRNTAFPCFNGNGFVFIVIQQITAGGKKRLSQLTVNTDFRFQSFTGTGQHFNIRLIILESLIQLFKGNIFLFQFLCKVVKLRDVNGCDLKHIRQLCP